MRLMAATVAFCLLGATPGSADIVMLLSGESLTGTIANRDAVREEPDAQPHISLLPEDSEELLRFELSKIDYLVLEDDGERVVVDLSLLGQRPSYDASRHWSPGYRQFREIMQPAPERINKGIPLMVVGGAIGAVGALVKFGGEKATVTENSVDYSEDSYNAMNYSLMALGGGLFVIGVAMQSSESGSSASDHAALTIEPSAAPLSRAPGVVVSVRF